MQHRCFIRRQRLADITANRSIYDFTINRKYRFKVFFINLGFLDQCDHFLCRPHVIRTGLNRDHHQVCRHNGGTGQIRDAGWAINDDVVIILGELADILVQRGARQPQHRESGRILPCCRPIQGATLRIGIKQQYTCAIRRQTGSNIDAESGFANSPFLVQYRDNHQVLLVWVITIFSKTVFLQTNNYDSIAVYA
ncbi:hypothetical protein DR88_5234 [Klebsiella pneumoniae]|nr:hypothetical protein DR88_5234 [Klebsiella pneumoniae]